jgi:CheY-like chemotaxis protein
MISKKLLLYVEDDPGSRKVMLLLVNGLVDSVELVIFEDSVDFLEKVDNLDRAPDAFLLDIHVIPHDGFSMIQMLRASDRYAEKMIIALTASVMNEEINKLKDAGFDGVLPKPLNFHTLPETIGKILSGERIWTLLR